MVDRTSNERAMMIHLIAGLTLSFRMLKNGQTYFKNITVWTHHKTYTSVLSDLNSEKVVIKENKLQNTNKEEFMIK